VRNWVPINQEKGQINNKKQQDKSEKKTNEKSKVFLVGSWVSMAWPVNWGGETESQLKKGEMECQGQNARSGGVRENPKKKDRDLQCKGDKQRSWCKGIWYRKRV